jgi:hypothetical protein
MADSEEDPAEAVQRLQVALERIAVLAARRGVRSGGTADPAKDQLAARLDALIVQLREALNGAADSKTTESR